MEVLVLKDHKVFKDLVVYLLEFKAKLVLRDIKVLVVDLQVIKEILDHKAI